MCAKYCVKRHFVSTVNICMQTKNRNPFPFYFLKVYCYSEESRGSFYQIVKHKSYSYKMTKI